MSACEGFRDALGAAHARGGHELARLAHDPHAAACAPCRATLARELGLERLLELASAAEAPAGLARRVLRGLAPEREPARAPERESARALDPSGDLSGDIDELLERVPPPSVPPGLAARVLDGLAGERAPRRARRRGWRWLAAAAALAGLALWAARAREDDERAALEGVTVEGVSELEADEELLAYAVERWELLHDEDLDVWLASLDPVDELLLEYAPEEAWLDGAADGPGEEGR